MKRNPKRYWEGDGAAIIWQPEQRAWDVDTGIISWENRK